MSEVVHTVLCRKCQIQIAEIVNSKVKEGYLELGEKPPNCSWWAMKRHSPTSDEFRFFCGKCGGFEHWKSGKRDFVEFLERPSLDQVITADGQPEKWRFARVTVPDSDFEYSSNDPNGEIKTCATAFGSSISMVNAIADSTLLSIGLSVSSQATRNHIFWLCQQERHEFNRDLGDNVESPNYKEFVASVQMASRLRQPLSADLWEKMRLNGEIVLDTWATRHTELTIGIRAALLAQISLAWTAFEALSTDLWIAALNERPNPLAGHYAKSVQGKGQDKNIALTALAKYADHDFNLSRVMGSMFVAEDKADFTSLQSTKNAYAKAFSRDLAVFDDDDLRLLELVRNLILHRAGIVDQQFIDALRDKRLDTHPDCANIVKGQPLHVDTDTANRLVTASANAGTALLRFVVNYLWPN